MNKYLIQKQIREKRAEAKKLTLACLTGSEVREMTPEESSKFDELAKQIETLQAAVARLESLEGDEEEAAAPPPAAERSGRRSAAMDIEERDAPERETRSAPAVHVKKPRPYSMLRAIQMSMDRIPLDGLEAEVSQELQKRNGRAPKGRMFVPLGADPEIRELCGWRSPSEFRDLTTTTGGGAIFTIPELPFIELLRARLVVKRMGATVLTGMSGGAFGIPRQTGQATVYWVAEGNSAVVSNPALDQVVLSPKIAIALVSISRKFMNMSAVDAESFVKNDLAKSMAIEWDRVALNGTGPPQPQGILQNTIIQANSAGLALGVDGGPLTWAAVIAMESQVSSYNADDGTLGYLTSPAARGFLKTTAKAPNYPQYIFEPGSERGVGEVNGYVARATTNIPHNLTKGAGTNLSAIIFGDWSSLILATWDDSFEFLTNPYSNQASGALIISTEMSMDAAVRHPESFSIITDVKTS